MRHRIESLLRNPRLQAGGDSVLALLLAGSSVGFVLGGDDVSWGSPQPLAIGLALLSTVPVAWRARRPLLAAAIVLAANGACSYVAAPHQAAFQPFVALTLVSYSVGSRSDGRLWAPPVLAVAAVPLFVAAVVHGQSAGNAIPNYVWLLAAWTVGRSVRSWRRKSVALELANHELAEQRELQARAAVAVERGRIARELHDVIAHNVSMMVVQAGAAERVLEGQQQVRDALDAIALTGRQTVDEMRTVLGVLRAEDGSAARRPQPGLADLEQLVASVGEAGLPVRLRIEGERRELPSGLDLAAYRVVQEALTNALKHGGGSADVLVHFGDDDLRLEIADGGGGANRAPGVEGGGHGLLGMRERVRVFGGELHAGPRPGGGFLVAARLPLQDEEEAALAASTAGRDHTEVLG